MECRACHSTDLKTYVDLGLQPPSNDYRHLPGPQKFYPLQMLMCMECGLGQLGHDVDPKEIFTDYCYFSSASPTWVADRKALADRLTNEFSLGPGSLVIDIGSNDGYFLRHFGKSIGVLGYEPAANVAQVARDSGIATQTEFWGVDGNGRCCADIINATNVLAHTPNPEAMLVGIENSLSNTGTALLEFPLLANLVKFNQLDTIYHEHYSYFSLFSLSKILDRAGLRIWRVETLPTHGGSVRVFACRKKARFIAEASVGEALQNDGWAPNVDFTNRAQKVRWDALDYIRNRRMMGSIVGYGAPAKCTVMCNFLGLSNADIEYVVDDSPAKQGRYVPGTNIPIVASEHYFQDKPMTTIIFPWNLAKPIHTKISAKFGDYSMQIATFVPELSITNP